MPPRKVPVRKAVPSTTPAPVASTSKLPPTIPAPQPRAAPAATKHATIQGDDGEQARQEGLAEWEQMCRPNWKGLGLMDPIKSVEVSCPLLFLKLTFFIEVFTGQMAATPRLSQSERSGETTHRLVQLLCRC